MDRNLTRGWMVEEYKYLTSQYHNLIGVGTGKHFVQNIGEDGENLTIAVLSMNRSSLTIRLMESIEKVFPEFKGEFLIGDNGSEETERTILRGVMARMPYKCRMVEFDRNYGVAGGRNRLYAEVKTDWLFQLDNDTYFIQNPLKKIQKDIALLGCHFLSMPILNEKNHEAFVYGGHLYVAETVNGIDIGGGSAYLADHVADLSEHEPFLCTFISGCASIIKKDTFFACGGYDEGMFVGFEDTEFSLRLFQEGYKIGTCGIVTLIHDHPKPTNSGDRDYEKQRFSNVKLVEAARYFEKKHGVQVWNPMVESWVNERLRELLDEDETTIQTTEKKVRPKILLVVDKPGWALDNIAKQIIRHCSDEFEFKILYLIDIDNVSAVYYAAADCDLIHFLWRSWLSDHNSGYSRSYATNLGMDPDEFYRTYVKEKVTCTSVYDHLFLQDDFHISEKLFTDIETPVAAYSVSSQILKDIYDRDDRFRLKPDCVITDGVNLDMFRPKNLDRFCQREVGQPLVIGWAGNSMWAAEKEDFKGLHTLLKPAVEQLQKEGYAIELRLCDSNEKMTPHHEMPDYYAGIDLYVCMSKIEGTPNPILESMACGVPFVSTRVGIVPEAAGPLQSKYILKERSIDCLKDSLKDILEHPEVLEELSCENLKSIQNWNWRERAREFIPMWQRALKK